MFSSNSDNHGFSLLELMITLIIVGICIALAVPGMQHLLSENRAVTRLDKIVTALQYTRSEGIKLATRVKYCPSSDKKTCGGCWQDGEIAVTENGVVLRLFSSLSANESLSFNGSLGKDDYIEFSPWGATTQIGSFCYFQDGRLRGTVIINSAGRVRTEITKQ